MGLDRAALVGLRQMILAGKQAWSCSFIFLTCDARCLVLLRGASWPAAGVRRAPGQAEVVPKARAAWRRASSAASSRLSTNVPA